MDKTNETAFIQSISENQYIREYCQKNPPPAKFSDILDYYDSHKSINGTKDTQDMKLFCSFMKNNERANDFVIQEYDSFGTDKGHSVLVTADKDVYVAFDGTNAQEWEDNGVGMYSKSTPQQKAAAEVFDKYMTAYGITEDNNVVVTGHSKGGNKAMFVTMASGKSHLIDSCIALDGQGFSPEAINAWKAKYGSAYNDRVNKITLISGENDYVHELGICIAGHKYTIGYQNWTNEDSIGGVLKSYHGHEWMFGDDGNGNFSLNGLSKPGKQEELLDSFMAEYMSLSAEDRKKSADKVMHIAQLFATGEFEKCDKAKLIKDIDEVLVILSETSAGVNIVNLASTILLLIQLKLSSVCGLLGMKTWPFVAALKAYLDSLKLRGWLRSINQKKKTDTNKPKTNENPYIPINGNVGGTGGHSSGGGYSGGSDNAIVLNKEAFEGLMPKFDAIFEEAKEGSEFAYDAEMVELSKLEMECRVNKLIIEAEADNIKQLVNMIIESFTSTDEKIRKEAEDIVGPEIHTAVSSGYNVIYNSNGEIVVQAGASIEGYQCLKQHLSDNCTNTSLAMMIQRYYMLHNGSCDLVYDDINKNSFYWAVEDYGKKMSRDLPNGGHYTTNGGSSSDLRDLGGGSPQAGLAAQLTAHPEGVVIYGRYGNNTGSHAVVISGCQVNADGSYTFTALDPATGQETALENSTLYSNSKRGTYGSVDDLLNNLFYYQYLESVT